MAEPHEHIPDKLQSTRGLLNHLLYDHKLGGISDVWTWADLSQFHDKRHAEDRPAGARRRTIE